MAHYKFTLFIITWLTFLCFSPAPSRAIINDSSTGSFSNRTFTEVGNLHIAQDSGSKGTKSEKTKKEKSTASDSKIPKQIRFILKTLRGRKTLFVLSITSVLVTGGAVFILLKLFDDHQPPEDFDPEDLASKEKIPEATSPDLEGNYPSFNRPTWPVAPENPSLANTENSLYSQGDRSELSAFLPISKFGAQPHHQDTRKETSPKVDSNAPINPQDNNNYDQKETEVNLSEVTDQNSPVNDSGNITLNNNYPLPQINIVEQLINELQNFDPKKRHQAIWELGQRGDSRAVQPLVNLLIDSDSKQQSLILATLSEIGIRTLKPMSRALAMSLQDDNAEVRKNAIRDLTRIYELVIQITNLLQQAEHDPDPEVEKTAKWALDQLNRIRPR